MARGKAAAAKAEVAVPAAPVELKPVHATNYICAVCHRHHGRYTKIGLAHRQYRTEKKV